MGAAEMECNPKNVLSLLVRLGKVQSECGLRLHHGSSPASFHLHQALVTRTSFLSLQTDLH